jgi:hypothetical protein
MPAEIMPTPKQQILNLLNGLPDDVTLDEILRQIGVTQLLQQRIEAADRGEDFPPRGEATRRKLDLATR